MAPIVGSRLRNRPADVDDVLQLVRLTVWRRSEEYDPLTGAPGAFVFGITRNLIRKRLASTSALAAELPSAMEASPLLDPLTDLVRRYTFHRWASMVATFANARDWSAVVDLAIGEERRDVIAARYKFTPETLRLARFRVFVTAYAVRAALEAADAGLAETREVLLDCVPNQGGLRAAAEQLGKSRPAIAAELGDRGMNGRPRARVGTAKRLVMIAHQVFMQERSIRRG